MRFMFFFAIKKNNIENKKAYFLAKLCEIRKNVIIQYSFYKGSLHIFIYAFLNKMYIYRFN